MLSLGLFTAFITNIGLVINGLVIYFTGAGSLYPVTSLASVIPTGDGVSVFLSAIDIFSIWSYILLALGLRYTGGISKKRPGLPRLSCLLLCFWFRQSEDC